ncbi:MAG: hypothetical protein COV52_03895 [Gammaproteobacteria bacterium CG11_big_fil_rev_8_21_14_0_20_46_22]|nr:MAG: hypothetical protein COW05_01945 [Gammaproteobacteria bacterium CG12_big_fil_rev_8_21_14_0_65_46_12]PIR11463.1 MAG: hypothetical protein COV52_03895 [Gammaproteobacteria bacterium CG11_big_fil_rev_8_21_14_0_20_46_22]
MTARFWAEIYDPSTGRKYRFEEHVHDGYGELVVADSGNDDNDDELGFLDDGDPLDSDTEEFVGTSSEGYRLFIRQIQSTGLLSVAAENLEKLNEAETYLWFRVALDDQPIKDAVWIRVNKIIHSPVVEGPDHHYVPYKIYGEVDLKRVFPHRHTGALYITGLNDQHSVSDRLLVLTEALTAYDDQDCLLSPDDFKQAFETMSDVFRAQKNMLFKQDHYKAALKKVAFFAIEAARFNHAEFAVQNMLCGNYSPEYQSWLFWRGIILNYKKISQHLEKVQHRNLETLLAMGIPVLANLKLSIHLCRTYPTFFMALSPSSKPQPPSRSLDAIEENDEYYEIEKSILTDYYLSRPGLYESREGMPFPEDLVTHDQQVAYQRKQFDRIPERALELIKYLLNVREMKRRFESS